MGRFKVKVTYEHYFSLADQSTILNMAFSSFGILRWASVLNIVKYNGNYSGILPGNRKKVTNEVTAILHGGTIDIVDLATNDQRRVYKWSLRIGIAKFCMLNNVHPEDVMSMMTVSIADQIIQLALFDQIKY